MDKESFIFHSDTLPAIEAMTDAQAGKLIKALCRYRRGMEVPELKGSVHTAFVLITQMISRDDEKFLKKIQARSEAGRKGGLATQAKLKQNKQSKANQAERERVRESESVLPNGNIKSLSLSARAREDLLQEFGEEELNRLETEVRVYHEARPDAPFSNMADEIRKFASNQARWSGGSKPTRSKRKSIYELAEEVLGNDQ